MTWGPAIAVSSLRAYGLRSHQGAAATLEVAVGPSTALTLPAIGFALDPARQPPSATTLERIKLLRPSHLRVEVDLSVDALTDHAEAAMETARSIGAPVELALAGVEGASEQAIAAAIASIPAETEIARVIVIGDAVWPARRGEYGRVLAAMPHGRPETAVLAGTRANFDIVNRDWSTVGEADGVALGMQPQWHAVDDLSVIETLEGQFDSARTARSRMGSKTVAISPVTLGPDYGAQTADPRHRSLFGAAWTIGSIASLARAGVDSATYYRLLGPSGVVAADRPAASAETSSTGPVHPCFHVFADLAGDGPARVREVSVGGVYPATAIVAEREGEQRVLIGSFAPVSAEVTVSGLSDGPWRLRGLDHQTAERALFRPEAFQDEWTVATSRSGMVRLGVGPYGLLTLVRDTAKA